MAVLDCLKSYPVYRLQLEDREQQDACASMLVDELAKHGITCTVLHAGKELHRYRVLQELRQNDIILISGRPSFPVKQIAVESKTAEHSGALCWSSPCGSNAVSFAESLLADAALCLNNAPVWACVLIGGKSSRMGQPKHLLQDIQGRTWLESLVASIRPSVSGIVFSGRGEIPPALGDVPRLPDIPGVQGPLNGILAAGRWQPFVSWLLLACDMPEIGSAGITWLLTGRTPGLWGRVPRLAESGFSEPLFAWYDFRAVPLFEQQLVEGNFRLNSIVTHRKIENPVVPKSLRCNWQNVNTPEQLLSYRKA